MRRTLQDALAVLRARVAGVTLVSVDRWTLAEELWSFGEDDLYLVAVDLSDEEMIQVWKRGGRLYMKGEARSAGEAAARAAVVTLEGRNRPLARRRRRPRRDRPDLGQTFGERLADVERIEDSETFPAAWR